MINNKILMSGLSLCAILLTACNNEDTSSNPTYKSVIVITGFPTIDATSTFEAVSDLRGFKGTTTIENLVYNYVGEFTGDPLTTHDKQGLILQFSTK